MLGTEPNLNTFYLYNYFINNVLSDFRIFDTHKYMSGLEDTLNKTYQSLELEKNSKNNKLINDILQILSTVKLVKDSIIETPGSSSNGVSEQNSSDLLDNIIKSVELSGTEDGKTLRDLLSTVIKKDMHSELYNNLVTSVNYDKESAKSNKDKILTLLQQLGVKSFNDSKLIREEIGNTFNIEAKRDRNTAYNKINDLLKQCK